MPASVCTSHTGSLHFWAAPSDPVFGRSGRLLSRRAFLSQFSFRFFPILLQCRFLKIGKLVFRLKFVWVSLSQGF